MHSIFRVVLTASGASFPSPSNAFIKSRGCLTADIPLFAELSAATSFAPEKYSYSFLFFFATFPFYAIGGGVGVVDPPHWRIGLRSALLNHHTDVCNYRRRILHRLLLSPHLWRASSLLATLIGIAAWYFCFYIFSPRSFGSSFRDIYVARGNVTSLGPSSQTPWERPPLRGCV